MQYETGSVIQNGSEFGGREKDLWKTHERKEEGFLMGSAI